MRSFSGVRKSSEIMLTSVYWAEIITAVHAVYRGGVILEKMIGWRKFERLWSNGSPLPYDNRGLFFSMVAVIVSRSGKHFC